MDLCHVKYVGATPGADSNVYSLFNTVVSELPQRGLAEMGVERVVLSLLHSNSGTLKWYKSQDRGVTWVQIGSATVTPVAATESVREIEVAMFADFKLEWTNGGSSQPVWLVDVALSDQRRAEFSPSGGFLQSSLAAWYRADGGITFGATTRASGTTPPIVTISGSATTLPGLYLQIDGAGTLGVATFKASADNGATFFATGIATAASVPLTGPLAGITAAFAAGTYATDNVYEGVTSAFADRSGLNNHLLQAVASKQPLFSVAGGPAGRQAVVFDGTDDAMKAVFTLAQPTTVFMVARCNTGLVSGTETLIDGATGNRMRMYRSTATQFTLNAGATTNSGAVTPQAWHYYTLRFNGTSSSVSQDGVPGPIGNAGALSGNGVTFGEFGSGTANAPFSLAEAIIYRISLSAGQAAPVENYLKSRYSL